MSASPALGSSTGWLVTHVFGKLAPSLSARPYSHVRGCSPRYAFMHQRATAPKLSAIRSQANIRPTALQHASAHAAPAALFSLRPLCEPAGNNDSGSIKAVLEPLFTISLYHAQASQSRASTAQRQPCGGSRRPRALQGRRQVEVFLGMAGQLECRILWTAARRARIGEVPCPFGRAACRRQRQGAVGGAPAPIVRRHGRALRADALKVSEVETATASTTVSGGTVGHGQTGYSRCQLGCCQSGIYIS